MLLYISLAIGLLAAYFAGNSQTYQAEQYLRSRFSKKDIVPGSGQFFDDIAASYDLLNQIISLGHHHSWKRTAISKLDGASSVLDVSTGTADLAISLALNSSVRVIGLDPSDKMLNVGRQKIEMLSGLIGKIELVKGVVEDLPFESNSFDGVVVAFGVRNFQDRNKGIAEMARVLKLGGRLVVLELSLPAGDSFLHRATRAFVQNVMPRIAAVVSGNEGAYQYLSDSMRAFPDADTFQNMLRDAGLEVESHEKLPPFGMGPDLFCSMKRAKMDET